MLVREYYEYNNVLDEAIDIENSRFTYLEADKLININEE